MGSSSSKIDSDKLYIAIQNTVKDLIIEYEIWSNDKLCDKMDLIFYDKIIKFKKDNLLDVSAAIGYNYNKDYDKKELCKLIINHFKKRIELLNFISKSISNVSDRILKAQKGNICQRVNKEVNDFITCTSIPNALWINKEDYQQIIESFKKDKRYEVWKHWIDNMYKLYYNSLEELLNIIRKIKQDIDNSLSDIEFDELSNNTKKIIEKLDTYSEIYYLLAINL